MPMLEKSSSVEDRQSFVNGEPYEPTAVSALVIKCRNISSGQVQASFYSHNGFVRIAKHAVCDKI
jgi:hypothetical protein